LTVSEKGDALLAELAPVQRQVNDVEFGCLSQAEFMLLLDLVERLIASSENAMRLQAYLTNKPAAVSLPLLRGTPRREA
jgi:hypothetical protein